MFIKKLNAELHHEFTTQHKEIVYFQAIANSPLAARTKGFLIQSSAFFSPGSAQCVCGTDHSISALFYFFPEEAASGRQT